MSEVCLWAGIRRYVPQLYTADIKYKGLLQDTN